MKIWVLVNGHVRWKEERVQGESMRVLKYARARANT